MLQTVDMLKLCATILLFINIGFVSSFGNSLKDGYNSGVFVSNFVKSPMFNGRTIVHLLSSSSSSGLVRKVPKKSAFARAEPQAALIINNSTVGVCICVTAGSCSFATPGTGASDGSGSLDPRIISNEPSPAPTASPSTVLTVISSGLTPGVITQNSCQTGLERCCPLQGYSCGIRYPPISGSKAHTAGQAAYGAHPWLAVILTTSDVFIGTGALIDQFHVLTAAHKVAQFSQTNAQLKIRLGVWNASSPNELIPIHEAFISRIFIHPQYNSSNLKNDIAILRAGTAIQLGSSPAISPICLPSQSLPSGRCFVAGWGKNDFSANGQYQSILKEVDLPIVDQTTCQMLLRATRLGSNFVLDTQSFMCAGGEAGKDACTGDGGSPLVCLNAGKWFAMGLTCWGIGCGSAGVPAAYVNIASYVSWIQATTRSP